MLRTMFKSKIHRATVTDANLAYEGSITIDNSLLQAADILPHELVHIYNLTNGARFTTYVIEGKADSGEICINGAAARLARKGDMVIIATYVQANEEEIARLRPINILVDARNRIVKK
ncbi:MAG: aspartate 1-decarboxylase [Deltaproteobacteria bacterium]|nr:aspartate 1-decarboxylase [Candidatus Anaeroferrophillus wilburensis]MBN2890104.1 aspartate 1-decarboxylase [Deltaproteobacteria bacterium]